MHVQRNLQTAKVENYSHKRPQPRNELLPIGIKRFWARELLAGEVFITGISGPVWLGCFHPFLAQPPKLSSVYILLSLMPMVKIPMI